MITFNLFFCWGCLFSTMDNLVEDFAVRKLSKEVRNLLQKLNMNHPNNSDMDKLFKKQMLKGTMTQRDFLFLKSRILLNDFCYDFEEKFGRDLKTGFLFSCVNQKRLLFGAGSTYPNNIKVLLSENDYTSYLKNVSFDRNEFFSIHDYSNTTVAEKMVDENIYSGFTHSIHHKDFFMGVFTVFFPYTNGTTKEIIEYLRERIPTISTELYMIRNDLAIAVEEFENKQLKKAID